jgi:hypothetical protein
VFVRVDNQFGSSPFYSGAAWVFFLADVWLAHFAFLSFPHFVRETGMLFADTGGSIFTEGSVETDTLLYIR